MTNQGQGSEVLLVGPQGDARPLKSRPFSEGMFGTTLEDALQRLIEEHPGVLPGAQMDPGGDDPPRFVLLCREMPVNNWRLDHLLVDQHGVLTLLEAKLMENPEARRAVIGQIMDYAASAVEYWGQGKVRELAADFWTANGRDVDVVLREALGEEDVASLWERVEQNLTDGRIRLIVVGDEIRPEARKVLEFLNKEMANVEVFGLELTCYGNEDEALVVVPRLLGQTQAAHDRKKGHVSKRAWPMEMLREAVDADQLEGRRLLQLAEWAVSSSSIREARTNDPSFAVDGPTGQRVLSAYLGEGSLFCWTGSGRYRDAAHRDGFIAALRGCGLLSNDFEPDALAQGKYLSKGLADLEDKDVDALMAALSDVVR